MNLIRINDVQAMNLFVYTTYYECLMVIMNKLYSHLFTSIRTKLNLNTFDISNYCRIIYAKVAVDSKSKTKINALNTKM